MFSRFCLRAQIGFATVRAGFNIVPIALPLLAPGKGTATGFTGFGGKLRFFDHPCHGNLALGAQGRTATVDADDLPRHP
jgi:hypothetical protein